MRNHELGRKIKELRVRLGVSQDELGEISQLSSRTIQRIENGETEPRGDSLKRLSKALQVNIEDLTLPTAEISMAPTLKADKNILLLLIVSTFGFIIFPLFGIIFPWILWTVYKDKISGVDQQGKQIMKSQAWWCLVLGIVYLMVYSSKLLHVQLPKPLDQVNFLVVIGALYVLNTLGVLIGIFKCQEITKSAQRLYPKDQVHL